MVFSTVIQWKNVIDSQFLSRKSTTCYILYFIVLIFDCTNDNAPLRAGQWRESAWRRGTVRLPSCLLCVLLLHSHCQHCLSVAGYNDNHQQTGSSFIYCNERWQEHLNMSKGNLVLNYPINMTCNILFLYLYCVNILWEIRSPSCVEKFQVSRQMRQEVSWDCLWIFSGCRCCWY